MEIIKKKIEKNEEQEICIGLIISDDFIRQIKLSYKKSYFTLPYAKMVSFWCIEYYEKYNKAPFKDIKSIFEIHKKNIFDEATVEMIDTFLNNLSLKFEEYGQEEQISETSIKLLVDKTLVYFKIRSAELLIERINTAKLANNYSQMEYEIASYRRVEKLEHAGIEVWRDLDAHLRAIRSGSENNIIFQFPGSLGELVRPFKRQDFISVISPAKRGKSWLLMEIALMSSMAKHNVLYVSLEMTEEQMLLRLQQRILAITEHGREYVGEISVPYFDTNYDMNGLIHVKKIQSREISTQQIIRRIDSINSLVKSKHFKMICYPSGGLKASDIAIHLDNFAYYDDFIPDVICIDYADILAPERNIDKRDQIDETWRELRKMSQERNCLVATVSHTNKATFDRDIRQGDFTEDIRKINHLTWAGALNQNEDDIERGIMRFSVVADRFGRFNPKKEVVILQCLDLGQCYLDSRFLHNCPE